MLIWINAKTTRKFGKFTHDLKENEQKYKPTEELQMKYERVIKKKEELEVALETEREIASKNLIDKENENLKLRDQLL